MQIKRPRIAPAVALIGRIDAEGMTRTIQYLDSLGAFRWEITAVNRSTFSVAYWPNRGGQWEAVFDFNGVCVAD